MNYNYFGINSVTSVISHYNLDRLPPGVFTCPSGFFACDTFDKINERRNSHLQWPYRICLPMRLWCDKVLNCPISGSDEQNCSSTPPMSFPHTKFQIENEYRMLNDVLNQFENTSLLEFVGYRKKTSKQPITMVLSAYVNTFWLSLILLISIFIIFIITILLCLYKLLKRKREAGTVRVTEVKDYPTNSEICNDHTLKNSINNNHYSENAFSEDQLNKEETCNDDFQNNNSSNGSGNNEYHKFLPSDVNYLNGYLNSLGNQEIAPLINVTEKQ